MKLVKLTIDLETEFNNYINQWKEAGESIVPSCLNQEYDSFAELVKIFDDNSKGINLLKGYIPATAYFLIDDDRTIIGCLQIRHELNDYLYKFGGHIGYGIAPNKRGKGYGKKMLELALPIAKELGIEEVLITCKKMNMASSGVMKANGAVYINDALDDKEDSPTFGILFERYKILL